MALECLVIGLGVFGKSLAENLKKQGAIVIGMDTNDKVLKESEKFLDQTIKADATIEDNLRIIGLEHFDYAFVCIGVNMEASLIVTLHLNNLGTKKIVARSNSAEHSLILKRLGAHSVITPEIETGERLAQKVTSNFENFIKFSDNFAVIQMEVLPGMVGKNLIELNLRTKHRINVLSIKRTEPYVDEQGEDTIYENIEIIPDPHYQFRRYDIIYIAGDLASINRFISYYTASKAAEA